MGTWQNTRNTYNAVQTSTTADYNLKHKHVVKLITVWQSKLNIIIFAKVEFMALRCKKIYFCFPPLSHHNCFFSCLLFVMLLFLVFLFVLFKRRKMALSHVICVFVPKPVLFSINCYFPLNSPHGTAIPQRGSEALGIASHKKGTYSVCLYRNELWSFFSETFPTSTSKEHV